MDKEIQEQLIDLYVKQKSFLFKQMIDEQEDLKDYINKSIIKEPVLLDLFQVYGSDLSGIIIKKWEEEIKRDEQENKTSK